MKSSRVSGRHYIMRPQRFRTDEEVIQLIAKNRTSRFSCFWMVVNDISKTGVCVSYEGRGTLPVRMDDVLLITLDVTCKVFDRPLHLSCEVVWIESKEDWQDKPGLNKVFLGLRILEIEEQHLEYWSIGLRKYGNPDLIR